MSNALPKFEDAYPREFVLRIIAEFQIPLELECDLKKYLLYAYEIYCSQRRAREIQPKAVADKQSAKRLRDALRQALDEIHQPEMWSRLNMANKIAFPDSSECSSSPTPLWFPDMLVAMEQMHKIAEAAYTLDGKTIKGKRQKREDVRGFAVALWNFWTGSLGRTAVIHERRASINGFTQFVLDCLHQIDDTATDSPFRDLPNAAS